MGRPPKRRRTAIVNVPTATVDQQSFYHDDLDMLQDDRNLPTFDDWTNRPFDLPSEQNMNDIFDMNAQLSLDHITDTYMDQPGMADYDEMTSDLHPALDRCNSADQAQRSPDVTSQGEEVGFQYHGPHSQSLDSQDGGPCGCLTNSTSEVSCIARYSLITHGHRD